MTIKKEFKIRNFIEKKLKNNENKKFKKGKSSIPLAIPPYGKDEILEALDSLLAKQTTMGTKVKKFEKKFSEYIANKHSLMVNSGSSANLLALSILSNLTRPKGMLSYVSKINILVFKLLYLSLNHFLCTNQSIFLLF